MSDPNYPIKQVLALEMVREFTQCFPSVAINAVLADALYGSGEFTNQASAASADAQVVSQLRGNQLVISRGRKVALSTYFARQPGVETQRCQSDRLH